MIRRGWRTNGTRRTHMFASLNTALDYSTSPPAFLYRVIRKSRFSFRDPDDDSISIINKGWGKIARSFARSSILKITEYMLDHYNENTILDYDPRCLGQSKLIEELWDKGAALKKNSRFLPVFKSHGVGWSFHLDSPFLLWNQLPISVPLPRVLIVWLYMCFLSDIFRKICEKYII